MPEKPYHPFRELPIYYRLVQSGADCIGSNPNLARILNSLFWVFLRLHTLPCFSISIHQAIRKIYEDNRDVITNPDRIRAGMKIKLYLADVETETTEAGLPSRARTYTVRKGDSLWKIARAMYGQSDDYLFPQMEVGKSHICMAV